MKKVISIVCLLALTVSCLFAFTSCGAPNKDPEKAVEALEDAGYKAADVDVSWLQFLGIKGIDKAVKGTYWDEENEKLETITVYYFESAEDAESAWESISKKSDEENKDDDSDWVCKQSGTMIYYGTKKAIKAAK